MIKILLISVDTELKLFINNNFRSPNYQIIVFNTTNDPLEVMSQVFNINPSILILDDDFTGPDSAHLLSSIKKAKSKLNTIFITSDSSLELGRKIHSIGVKFYMIKPVSEFKICEFLKSIEREESNLIY